MSRIIDDFKGWSNLSYFLLVVTIFLQFGVLLASHNFSALSVSTTLGAISGVICTLMVANKRVSNALFGILAGAIIIINAVIHHVWADALLQVGYIFILYIPTIVVWSKHTSDSGEVEGITGLDTAKDWAKTLSFTAIVFVITFAILSIPQLHDRQPMVDALSFSLGITASVLSVNLNRSQYFFWVAQDVVLVILWFRATMLSGNGLLSPLALMYVVYFIIDCVGMVSWSNDSSKKEVTE